MFTSFVGVLPITVLVAVALLCLQLARKSRQRALEQKARHSDSFLVKPYLQLGDARAPFLSDQMDVLWCATDPEGSWSLDVRHVGAPAWETGIIPQVRRIGLVGTRSFYRFNATVKQLSPGGEFDYRVRLNGEIVFEARGLTRKGRDQAYTFSVLGDFASGSHSSKEIAYRLWEQRPDFVFAVGDVVYKRGRVSEYLEYYFPVYNSDTAGPDQGAPLLRSRLFLAAAGNHDVGTPDNWDVRDFNEHPDLLGFYLFWSLPSNGPALTTGGANTPLILGDGARQEAFLQAAHGSYPGAANYSFDYANSHWTVIDANNYMDWTDEQLRSWLDKDLKAAKGSVWKFVCFHQPSFSSDAKHWREQRMRLVADILQKHHVDVVFSGHHHAYERTFPLRFAIQAQSDGKLIAQDGQVAGDFQLDKAYDGQSNTKPDGIIYIVTGAAGAPLNHVQDPVAPITQRPFTFKLNSDVHSFTTCQVDGRKLTVQQVAKNGSVIDSFVVTK